MDLSLAGQSSSVHDLLIQSINALVEAIEKKDSVTGGHTKRVVHYSTLLAHALGITDPAELEVIRLGSLMHDVGKIGIEDSILKKPAVLNNVEWIRMREHPRIGEDILKRINGIPEVINAALYHHERWDGKGYPEGLVGEQIPLIARIVAVADAYDAIVSHRPYRQGSTPAYALEELRVQSGTHFDPRIIEASEQAFAV